MASPRKREPAELKAVHPVQHWLLAGVAGAVLLTLTAWGGVWGYHQAKVWRARQLAAEVPKLQELHERTQAEARLMAAFNLAPFDSEVLRSAARYWTAAKNPYALGFYKLLLASPTATRADQRDAAAACLAFGDIASANELVAGLMAQEAGADDFALRAQLLWQMRDPVQAIATVRQALALAPDSLAHQLQLAAMLEHSEVPEDITEATNLLEKMVGNNDSDGLQALVLLSRDRELDEKALRDILGRLQRHPLLDDNGRMATWELEKRLNPYGKDAVLGHAVDFFKSTDIVRRAVAGRWLYNQGEPAFALQLAPLVDAIGNEDLFKLHEDAVASMGRWDEVERDLNGSAVPLPGYLLWLYKARCAFALGHPQESDADWERARDKASNQPGALSELTAYALELQLYEQARRTLVRMTKTPTEAKTGYLALLQLEAGQGTSAEVLDTLHQMSVDFPKEPEPKNDWAYLSLLLNQNVDAATEVARNLVRDYPQFLAYRSTLALACLRHHDPQGAGEAYVSLKIDWAESPASWKMIYATVLAAQGKKNEGLTLIRNLPSGHLRPEELAFFQTYFPGA